MPTQQTTRYKGRFRMVPMEEKMKYYKRKVKRATQPIGPTPVVPWGVSALRDKTLRDKKKDILLFRIIDA